MLRLLPDTFSRALPTLLASTLLVVAAKVQSQELPLVSGVSYDGELISWEPLEQALGYDIYLGPDYTATVVGITNYRPEALGFHSVVAFDENGVYSPILPEDRSIVTSNSVVISELAAGVDQPANVRGIVYSTTAGEIFWDPDPTRNLLYTISLNGEFTTASDGTSAFIPGLIPDSINLVSIVARTSTGETSEPIVLEFDTQGVAFPIDATFSDSDSAVSIAPVASLPVSPQNVRLEIYGANSAELFWDRPPLSDNIVSTDIFRNGSLLGNAEGNSFFDGAGFFSFGSIIQEPTTYELVAIDGNGARSLPATINPGAFDQGPFDDSDESISQRILKGITEVTTNNPHVQWSPILQDLANNGSSELQEVDSTTLVEDGIAILRTTLFNCDGGGTLTMEEDFSILGTTRLIFDLCGLDRGSFDGSFTLSRQDAGSTLTTYENLFIDTIDFPVDMNGEVLIQTGRAFGDRSLVYIDFEYGIIGNLLDEDGLDTSVTLNQRVSDSPVSAPRHSFETEFLVSAPFTNGREIFVATTTEFEEVIISEESGLPNYLAGELVVDSFSGDLNLVTDPADVTRYIATVIQDDIPQTFGGFWSDSIRLPCISATPEDEAISGCPFP